MQDASRTNGHSHVRDPRGRAPDRRLVEPISILIVDSHALFRVGLRKVIESQPDMRVVAETDSVAAAISATLQTSPEIAIVDLALPAPGGIEAISRIRRALASCAVIVLANDDEALFDALEAGAAVLLSKNIEPGELISAIRRVHAGEFAINDAIMSRPDLAGRVLDEFRQLAVYGGGEYVVFAPLSPREVEILDTIAQGLTNKEAAGHLGISEQTVKNHMSSVLRKLSVNDRTQAVVHAIRQGWIQMPEA